MRGRCHGICLGVAGLTALALLAIRGLQIRVSEREMLADEGVAAEHAIRSRFGDDRALVAAFERLDGELLEESGRADWRAIIAGLAGSEYLALQLVDPIDRPRFGAGGDVLLEPPPPGWLERALDVTHILPSLQVARSRRAVLLTFPQTTPEQQRAVAQEVERVFEEVRPALQGRWDLRLVGQTIVLDALGREIEADLWRTIPLVIALVIVLLTLVFRSPEAALIATLEVGISTLWTLGLLHSQGHDLSLMTALLPVLIMAMGVADEIHLFAEFFRLRAAEPGVDRGTHAWQAVRTLWRGVTATSFTTAVALFSFAALDIPALRAFGLYAGVGVLFSWLLTLTFVPAVLTLVPIGSGPAWVGPKELALPWRLVRRGVGIGALLLLPGLAFLRLNDGWTGNFSASHELVRNVRWLEAESSGLHRFDVVLERKGGTSWEDPAGLAALARFQADLDELPELNGTVSLVDLLRDRAWELGDPQAILPSLPESESEVRRLLRTYRIFNEAGLLATFLDSTRRWTSLWAYLDRDDYATAQRVHERLDALVAKHFGGDVSLSLGGSAERGRRMIERLVTTQLGSLVLDFFLCYAVLVALFGDWLRSARCLANILLGLALLLGIVGWIGLPLGVASSAFLGLSLGTGIDYAVHLEFSHLPGTDPGAARDQLRLRVLFNVAVFGAGMSVLLFSHNPTIRALGGLVVASQIVCGFTAVAFAGGPLWPRRSVPSLRSNGAERLFPESAVRDQECGVPCGR